MVRFLLALAIFFSNPSCAMTPASGQKLIKVAVVDTGKPVKTDAPVCPSGHRDFSGLGLNDTHGHASHVADVIDQNVKNSFRTNHVDAEKDNSLLNRDVGYCLVFFKYYNEKATGLQNLTASNKALKEATRQKVDVIVYAGGGAAFNHEEQKAIKGALNAGIKVIAAAGNEKSDVEVNLYFPAQYDSRVQIVGNMREDDSRVLPDDFCSAYLRKDKTKAHYKCGPSSNYGKPVTYWEIGTSVLGKVDDRVIYMTGTSQATAVRAGKVVREMIRSRK